MSTFNTEPYIFNVYISNYYVHKKPIHSRLRIIFKNNLLYYTTFNGENLHHDILSQNIKVLSYKLIK